MTAALLDRLTHKGQILEFIGESYRFRQRLLQEGRTGQPQHPGLAQQSGPGEQASS